MTKIDETRRNMAIAILKGYGYKFHEMADMMHISAAAVERISKELEAKRVVIEASVTGIQLSENDAGDSYWEITANVYDVRNQPVKKLRPDIVHIIQG